MGRKKLPRTELLKRFYSEERKVTLSSDVSDGTGSDVVVKCKKCGHEWKTTIGSVLANKGCPNCKNRKSPDGIVDRLRKVKPDIVPHMETYRGVTKPMTFHCKVCNNVFEDTPSRMMNNHSRYTGCPNCSVAYRRTNDEFIRDLHKINPNIDPLDQFTIVDNRMRFKCRICGHEWSTTATHVLCGTGCPKCNGGVRKTHKEFASQASEVHPEIEILSEYIGCDSLVKVRCSNCGEVFDIKASKLLQDNPCCKTCIGKKKYEDDLEYFLTTIPLVNPDITVLGEFVSNYDKIRVKCNLCGHEWDIVSRYLFNKCTCPKCVNRSTSYAEQFLYSTFVEIYGYENVLNGDRKTINGKELDIYIPSLSLAVEFGSWIWHITGLANDINKKSRCKEKGIRLITIYDSVPEGIEPLFDDCIMYNNYLKDKEELIPFAISILDYLNISHDTINWDTVENSARYRCSHNYLSDRFRDKLKRSQPYVKLIGRYARTYLPIKAKCTYCGNKWEATPGELIDHGCPECEKLILERTKMTPERFSEIMRIKGPNVLLLENYPGNNGRVKVRCKTCGHEWSPLISNMVRGCGCNVCSLKERSGVRRWRFSDFGLSKGDEIEFRDKTTSTSVRVVIADEHRVFHNKNIEGIQSVAYSLGWKKDGSVLKFWFYNNTSLYELGLEAARNSNEDIYPLTKDLKQLVEASKYQ